MQQKGAVFFVKKITVLLTAAVLLLSACSSATLNSAGKELEDTLASAADSSNPYVQMVKGGYRADDPGTTYNDAFSSFFGAPRWQHFESEDGENVVEFTGDCTYQDVPVKARIQFVVDEEAGTFEAVYLAFNEVPQNMLTLTALLETAFEEGRSGAAAAGQTAGTTGGEPANQLLYKGVPVDQLLGYSYDNAVALLGEPDSSMYGGEELAYGDSDVYFDMWSGPDPFLSYIGSPSLADFTYNGQPMSGDYDEMTRIFGREPDEAWVDYDVYTIRYNWDHLGSQASLWVSTPSAEGSTAETSISVSWWNESDASGGWEEPLLDEALCGRWRASDGSSLEFSSDGTLTSANFQIWPTFLFFHDWIKPYYVSWQASNGQITFTSYFSETCSYKLGTTSFYDSDAGQMIEVDQLSIAGYQAEARMDALTGDGIAGSWGWRNSNTVRTVLNDDGTGTWLDHPITWWVDGDQFTMDYQGVSTYDYYIMGDTMEFFFNNGSKSFVKVGD